VVTTLLCLPIRPRGWQAAVGYAAAIAAALLPAWWFGVREPVPTRQTRAFVPDAWDMVWSPDGRWLYCSGSSEREKATVCHVVDATTAGVRRLYAKIPPLCSFSLRAPASRHLLYTDVRKKDGKPVCEMWAVEAVTGEKTLLHTAPNMSVPSQDSLSPDGREMIFLAGAERPKEAFILQLTDLTTRKLATGVDFSRFGAVRWQRDGGLLLSAYEYIEKAPTALCLWRLAPGDKEPRRLHRVPGYQSTWRLSPNTRWGAVVNRTAQPEIIDLITGKQAVPGPLPPGLSTMQSAWSPDGEAFAYVAEESGQHALIVVRPATGEVSRPYTTGQQIASLELSPRGRYAACRLKRSWREHLRIVDTLTGRVIRPHVATAFLDSLSFAWSPVGQVLAVDRANTLVGDELSSSIHLFELPP